MKSKTGKSGKKKDVYTELCGAMSPPELKRMNEAEKEFEMIDVKNWK